MSFKSLAMLGLLTIASQILSGCGSSSSSPNPAALTGNWLLAGSHKPIQYPYLSAAVEVNGNQVTAQGDMLVPCSQGSSVGGTFSLSGQLNSDGTFHLGEVQYYGQVGTLGINLVIDGSAPAGSSNTWTGTYSFTDVAGYTACLVNLTAPLNATALQPINASYAGTISDGPYGSVGSLNINASIIQEAATTSSPTSLRDPVNFAAYLPLTGTITVTGSPCFTHGTSTTGSGNVEGDYFEMLFTMDDGSIVQLGGVTEPDQNMIDSAGFLIETGPCSSGHGLSGTLTRQ